MRALIQNLKSKIQNYRISRAIGQASLEMTLALTCGLLLLFGSMKIFLWMSERLVNREQAYERTRVGAASIRRLPRTPPLQDVSWDDSKWDEQTQKLAVFQ